MRDQGKKESSSDLSAEITFWSCSGIIIVLIFLSMSCSKTTCPDTSKQLYIKGLKKVKYNLRVKYKYHQNKTGKLFNFNLF
jgi:predicted nucleic acid binding AN1-type Zn finger protein